MEQISTMRRAERGSTPTRQAQRITESTPRTLRPGVEVRDSLVRGFGIRRTGSGYTWFLVYPLRGGRRRRLRLGSWPAIGVKDARRLAMEALREVELGGDPADCAEPTTLREAFEEYKRNRLSRLATGEAMAAVLERDLLRALGSMPLYEITRRDIVLVVDRVENRGSPVTANRLLQYTKAMFNAFVERELLDSSPADRIRKRIKERARDRVLTDDELRRVWQAADLIGYPFGPFVQLLVLTGLRRSELALARREDLAGRTLTIPNTKTGVRHVVTLTDQAASIVIKLPPRGKLFKSSVTGKDLSGWSKMRARLARRAGLDPRSFTLHDLRRTMASGMAALEIDPVVIELCLGHVPSGVLGKVGAIYNRHSYAKQMAKAWQKWADHTVGLADAAGGSFASLKAG